MIFPYVKKKTEISQSEPQAIIGLNARYTTKVVTPVRIFI